MKYTPYTESQIQSMNVMDEGTYTFKVLEVITTDKYNKPLCDKNGTEMAKLKLLIWDNHNRERTLFTYVTGDGAFAYKLRHFAKTIGMLSEYELGEFVVEKTIGKIGTAEVVLQKGTSKNDGTGDLWPDRNDVKDFIGSPDEIGKHKSSNVDAPLLDDDIAF